jgi:hypothetical protein
MGERSEIQCLALTADGNRACGRPRNRYESKMKMHLKEIGCHGVDKIYLGKDRAKLGR